MVREAAMPWNHAAAIAITPTAIAPTAATATTSPVAVRVCNRWARQ